MKYLAIHILAQMGTDPNKEWFTGTLAKEIGLKKSAAVSVSLTRLSKQNLVRTFTQPETGLKVAILSPLGLEELEKLRKLLCGRPIQTAFPDLPSCKPRSYAKPKRFAQKKQVSAST